MKKFVLLLACIVSLFIGFNTYGQNLSEQAEISIVNYGPGEEVYSIWGHTAIWVKDPVMRIDKVFNYGTYDFDTPNFVGKFMRGKLLYTLSVGRSKRAYRIYMLENRSIIQQVLDMELQEKEKLYALLLENYKKENRYYKYDFFFDNCATRPLEIIEKSMKDPIIFSDMDSEKTYRDILDEHLTRDPWLDFGIDLIIGAKADKVADPRQQMFMPVYIYEYFRDASRSSDSSPVVSSEKTIFQPLENTNKSSFSFKPVFLFYLLLAIELFLFLFSYSRKKAFLKIYDQIFFGILFVGSLFLLFMWFGTDHLATKNNWNLIWMNPLLIFLFFPGKKTIYRYISFFLLGFLLISILGNYLLPQQYHIAVLPIVLILLLKITKGLFFIKK